jgi:uncharacterized membrane protein YkvA (DUF1232 family)
VYMIKKSNPIRPWMLRKEFIILFFALKDNRTGWLPKLITVTAVFYLISPIDIIPDFIPVFGYLDDLVIVPLLVNLAIHLLPASVREESVLKAAQQQKKFIWIMILIALLIGCMLAGTIWLFWHNH